MTYAQAYVDAARGRAFERVRVSLADVAAGVYS